MTPLQKYEVLKKDADRDRRDAERAQGAVDQLESRLFEEFGFKDIDAAIARRDALTLQKVELSKQLAEGIAALAATYPGVG